MTEQENKFNHSPLPLANGVEVEKDVGIGLLPREKSYNAGTPYSNKR